MSQVQKRTRRARELAGSVWPGMAASGYANLIAARLRKLASIGSTGMLPVSGPGNGTIYFRDGQVAYAESSRTPTPARRAAGLAPLGGKLTDMLMLAEPTIDAVTELLSNESRYAKFRQWDAPPAARVCAMPVEELLAEVGRRRRLLRQLAVVITADTPIVRGGALNAPRLQVSPPQWALIVRSGTSSTPRALALELGRSVFSTTIEVYRLLMLGLLAVPGQPPLAADGLSHRPDGGQASEAPVPRAWQIMSFIRAVSDERGSDA